MDSVDFNSYLPKGKELDDVKETPRYKTYRTMLLQALEFCQDVIKDKDIPKEIKKNIPPDLSDKNKRTQYLIYHLFKTKIIRLVGRKQTKWEDEKKKYVGASHRLHKAFYDIPKDKFYEIQKGRIKRLEDDFNWAKVLYYNEFAICYSGLTESSMSLGYAEAAKSILEKIRPKLKETQANRKYENDRIFKLHTFALCNKGEAERNLHDYDKALSTFTILIDKLEKIEKSSDYYQALFRLALILNDQGRSVEAIKVFEEMKVRKDDTRYGTRDLEKASALIDQKEYIGRKGAYAFLKPYINDAEWENTFMTRKAKACELRLLIEFKKNRPEDLNKTKEEAEIETIKNNCKEFPQNAKNLLKECVERYDENNFKKTCVYLADYFHEKKNWKKELAGYYLYLCHKSIFEERDKLEKKSKKAINIIEDWISQDPNLARLIKKYDDVRFSQFLSGVDDEPCLRGFFNAYYEICTKNKYRPNKCEKEIIGKLNKRLIAVYHEKDNLIELEEVEERFSLLNEEWEEEIKKGNKKKARRRTKEEDFVKFIRECFFKGKSYSKGDKRIIYLRPDSVLTKMRQNTDDFENKVVGKSKLFPSDGKFKGRLTVLRRWNSFTPTLASSVNPSKGGGYFLYFQYKNESLGIVVDPGHDFLDNLFSQGFRIGDINAVIVSHAHPDHADNLPSILSLFHEVNHRLGKDYYRNRKNKTFNKKHLKLILSQGVFSQYYKLIKPSEESLKDVFVIQTGGGGQSKDLITCYDHEFDDNHSLKIETFATSHKDLSQWESLGFIFTIIKNEKSIRQIGYTSDAHWRPDFSKKFKDCNIICAHLGSIVDILGKKEFCSLCGNYKQNGSGNCKNYDKCEEENFKNGRPTREKLLKQAREQSHLYLSGLAMFFDELLPKGKSGNNEMELAVISEFGEELKSGIRMDLYHKFDNWFQKRSSKKAKCVPGDIGLTIDLLNCNIFCCCCREYKSKNRISPITYGREEAIFFVCDECMSVLSTYQIQEKLRDYHENGRKLELADESR